MKNFNELTPEETERLAILAEECAEVIQIIGKILRHGFESHSPFDDQQTPNRDLLTKELGDLKYAMELSWNDVDAERVEYHCDQKERKIVPYLHHQTSLLTPQEAKDGD